MGGLLWWACLMALQLATGKPCCIGSQWEAAQLQVGRCHPRACSVTVYCQTPHL